MGTLTTRRGKMKDLHTLDKYRDKDFEREYYGCNRDAGNGVFRVPVGGRMFKDRKSVV